MDVWFRFFSLVLVMISLNGHEIEAIATRKLLGNETDMLALLAIKSRIVSDPFQITSSWNTSLELCRWQGVTCGRRHRRVTRLDLGSSRLRGKISPFISNLSFIRVINFSNNGFEGEIPPEITRLFRLQVLGLGNNSMVGEIPANLSSCTRLKSIHLSSNNLTGKIPPDLGSLLRLTELRLMRNNLAGKIPPELGNATSIQEFNLALNSLEGEVPDSLGHLKSLLALRISGNRLSGTIPQSLYNFSKLTDFFAASNRFDGTIPREVGNTLPSLVWFVVWGNNLTGTIPISFANSSNLFSFEISSNRFFGGVPFIFGNLKKLKYLVIIDTNLGSGNANDLDFVPTLINCTNLGFLQLVNSNFGGKFPTSIGNLSTKLESLLIQSNPITGNIPANIGNLINLEVFSVFGNLLSGKIPGSIGKLSKLGQLSLASNRFSGEIPTTLGNLTSLLQLWLNGNNLVGEIPSSLSNCRNLLSLTVSNNSLNGTIPKTLLGLTSLTYYLNLSWNNLVGPLPSEIGNLIKLDQFYLDHNRLSGEIPASLGECTMLRVLNMDHNMFNGTIPDSLSLLRGIEQIDLSRNNLSGKIPNSIAGLVFLTKLNLSFNDLEGEVPREGVFGNVSRVFVVGNREICGGIPQLGLDPCSEKKAAKKWKLIISIVFGVLGLSLILFLVALLSIRWLKRRRNRDEDSSQINPHAIVVSYGDLLRATNGFSLENLIGTGSVGSVYKGVLDPDQTLVAVKVFDLEKRGASKSFISECKVLRSARHRNLVKIITACSGIDYQRNEFKALVYEFMPNGNLEGFLHPSSGEEEANPREPLSLLKRIEIAIDVASAVDYLHNQVKSTIIHCDIKPSNVLLGHENTAKIGDFGLARIVPQGRGSGSKSRNQASSSGLKGTIGYAPPEYGLGSKVSKEGDVYSFGILLLEMFTGKRPTDSDLGDGMNLNQYVKMVLPKMATEIVGQTMFAIPTQDNEATLEKGKQIRKTMSEVGRECCVSVLKIGVMCSDEFPKRRMKIDEALNSLHIAKKILLQKNLE